MSRIWAVARHMIAEGIRMKIALVFFVVIGLIVLGLPLAIEGDSSLTGAVQSFLSYSFNGVGLLLGMLTIFLSRSLSDELVGQQILITLTKPIPRWQFIVGKWLGISTLNAAFLMVAGLATFGMVQYIRWTHPPSDQIGLDEAALKNEILVARHALQFKLPDFESFGRQEFEQNREQGRYDQRPDFDPETELATLATKYEMQWRVVGPNQQRWFMFENVLCDRSPDKEIQIRYKAQVTNPPPDEIFRGMWIVGNPLKGAVSYERPVRHVVGRFHTVRAPADCVAEDNTLDVLFVNSNPFENETQHSNVMEFMAKDGVEVLFVVGSFGGNLIRLLILMMCKLMFLAAVGLLMTSVFSFPVACFASFFVYVLAGTRRFIWDSLDYVLANDPSQYEFKDYVIQVIMYLYKAVTFIIPDFGRYNGVETFVAGRNVGLVWVLDGILWLVFVQTLAVLGLATLLFHRREVAEVSI